jgi:hypothetical protein
VLIAVTSGKNVDRVTVQIAREKIWMRAAAIAFAVLGVGSFLALGSPVLMIAVAFFIAAVEFNGRRIDRKRLDAARRADAANGQGPPDPH